MVWNEFGKLDTKANELHGICKYTYVLYSRFTIKRYEKNLNKKV